MSQLRWITLLAGLSLALAACGTKGALFLPPTQPPSKTQAGSVDKPVPASAQETKGSAD